MKLLRIGRKLWRSSPQDWAELVRGRLQGEPRGGGEVERYAWCLSTGRVGTQTLAALAGLADRVDAQHEPKPLLYGLSKQCYDHGREERCREVLAEAVRTCRPPVVSERAKVYLETSPQVTFAAEFLREIYPPSRFIHVVRHPGAVVRSGMRRKWYAGNANDQWRIIPMSGPEEGAWPGWSEFEKNAWLWAETNRWIEEFMASLPETDGLVLRAEDLFEARSEAIESLFGHLGVERPARDEIEEVLGRKLNSQKAGAFPEMSDWGEEERAILERHAGALMEKYDYTFPRPE